MKASHFIDTIKRSCNKDEYSKQFGKQYEEAVEEGQWTTVSLFITKSSWAKKYALTSQRLLNDIEKMRSHIYG